MAENDKKPAQAASSKDGPIIPESIEYEFVVDTDCRPVFTNGVFGGIGPHGDLTMHFYHEMNLLPKSITHTVEESGKLGEETGRTPPKSTNPAKMTRYISTAVVMDEEMAKRLHEWLGKRLAQYAAGQEKAE